MAKTEYKLYDSKISAIKAGCKEEQLTEKNGVVYCDCNKKQDKPKKKVTKEDKEAYDTK